MNRMFDDFYRGFDLVPFGRWGEGWDVYSPRVDVSETDGKIVVSAELPGMESEDIDISLSEDVLTISGEKRQEKEENGKDYYRTECMYGSFERAIRLPDEVKADEVDATFDKGVLTVTLPKTAEAQTTKKIAVRSE
jgi:HSP20 family protein